MLFWLAILVARLFNNGSGSNLMRNERRRPTRINGRLFQL